MNNIGTKIMLLRKQNEMSQADLAKKLNVSNKLISKWETGNSLPATEYLPKLCQIFNVKINELMGEEVLKSASVTPKRDNKHSVKKWTIIAIICIIFFCLFIASCHFLIVPSLFKKSFVKDIDKHLEKTFQGTHYSLTTIIEIDDVPSTIKEYGYFENGKVEYIEYVDDKLQVVIKDGVKYNAKKKTRELFDNSKISCLYDLYLYDCEEDVIDEDMGMFNDPNFVEYIYKQFNGYYFELDKGIVNRFLDKELDSQMRITSKIKGDVDFLKEKFMSMSLTFKAKMNEKVMDIKVSESFDVRGGKKYVFHIPEIESVKWANLQSIKLEDCVDNENVVDMNNNQNGLIKAKSYLVNKVETTDYSWQYIYLYDFDMKFLKRIALLYTRYDFKEYFNVVGDYVYTCAKEDSNFSKCLYVIDLNTGNGIKKTIKPSTIKYISPNQTIYYGSDKLMSYNCLTNETKELVGSYKFHGEGDVVFTHLSEAKDGYEVGFYKITNMTTTYLSNEIAINSYYRLICNNDFYFTENSKLYNNSLQFVKNLPFSSSDIQDFDNNLIFTKDAIYDFNNLFEPPIKFRGNIQDIIILDDYYLIYEYGWYKVNKKFINQLMGN